MPTYVLMTKLGPEVLKDPRGRKKVGREWVKRVEKVCPDVKWVEHLVLLGPYDIMTIYEAPNNEVAHQVSMLSKASGAAVAESWPAISYERFLEIAKPVEDVVHKKR
jgi:uncharacterized protein with GYD domain